jgi:anti-anti-sigma factor
MAEIVVVEANDTLTHIALRGRLDLTGVEKVEEELARQTVARRKPAIVDITAVDLLPSIGIGMLIKTARSMHSYGLIFGVVATGNSKHILERLKVDTIFPIAETYEQTLRACMLE